jgi:hypothetical protein
MTYSKESTQQFLYTLEANTWMIPTGTSLTLAIFFLITQPNFLQAWEVWLLPCLRRAQVDVSLFWTYATLEFILMENPGAWIAC